MTRVGSGGAYSYRQLEQLWLSAGGNRALAPIMAAIAMAESGGDPNAENASGATGLWQILGAVHPADQSRLKDPVINAREAVAKYHTQGLKAWTTWTSGAYKKFLQPGVSPRAPVTGGKAFVDEAMKFFGDPYVWGGESPKGFDCSGLVQYVSQKLGLKNVPRTSEEQWAYVQHIPRSKLLPGDLVFYAGSDGTATSPGHVAIYQGGGKVIQALETGTNVGSFPIDSGGKPVGYGRLPGINQATGPGGVSANVGPTKGGSSIWDSIAGDILSGASSIGDVAGNLTGFGPLGAIAASIVKTEQAVAWFFIPNHWVRIFSGLIGTALVFTGIVTMTRTGKGYEVSVPSVGGVPAPGGQLAPALGIAEVTVGAILLFVAFHNLPDSVDNFGALVSHLQGQLQKGGAAA